MCGIGGIFHYRSEEVVDSKALTEISSKIASRGPDGSGSFINERKNLGLVHRRLAILDLDQRASQPMQSPCGRYQIVFNGEIYNHQALRESLKASGVIFRTESDTETLLMLYQRMGVRLVHKIRGMYAFAIWDEQEQSLFCARDPFGIKPFYYYDNDEIFAFASQVKALKTYPKVKGRVSKAAQVGFLMLGSVPEPFSWYQDISALPPGTFLLLKKGARPFVQRFYQLKDKIEIAKEKAKGSLDQKQITDALFNSVHHHLLSDVPVGLFLSGGCDSCALLSLIASQNKVDVTALTLGFEEFSQTERDEVSFSKIASQHFQVEQKISYLKKEDFLKEKARFLEAMDQPTIDGLNSYAISRFAAERGFKVAISGLGGDELFGGYDTFLQVPKLSKSVSRVPGAKHFGKLFRHCFGHFLSRQEKAKYASLFEYGHDLVGAYLLKRGLFMPWELANYLEPEIVKEGLAELSLLDRLEKTVEGAGDPAVKVHLLETSWYMRNQLLRDVDWAGMAHGVEIRTPLVDIDLYERLLPFWFGEPRINKRMIVESLEERLPSPIINRKKTGFFTPLASWVQEEHQKQLTLRQWANVVREQF